MSESEKERLHKGKGKKLKNILKSRKFSKSQEQDSIRTK